MIRTALSLRRRSVTALALLLTCAASLAQTWTGGGDGTSFNDNANWNTPVTPGSAPQFNSVTPLNLNQNSGNPLPIYALIQGAAGTGVTIGGNGLQFNSAGSYVNNASAAPITFNVPVTFTNDLTFYGNATTTLNSGLTGPGNVGVYGTVNLNAAGSFPTAQLQYGATLRAGVAGAFGAAAISLGYSNGVVEFATPTSYSFSGTFVGGNSDVVRQAGPGQVQFNTASPSYYGTVQVTGGILRAAVPNSLGNFSTTSVLSGGTLRLAGVDGFTGTSISIAPGGTLNGGGLAQNTFVSVMNDGAISLPAGSLLNAGGFVNWTGTTSGPGALGLGGFITANAGTSMAHTGGTTIAGGFIGMAGPNMLPDTGALVSNGGSLSQANAETVDTITLAGGSLTWGNLTATSIDLQSGAFNANGTVTTAPMAKTTGGTVTLGGTMVAPGGAVVSAGSLDVSGNITAPVTNNATLNVNFGSLSGAVVNNGTMTSSGNLNGTLVNNGSLTLSNNIVASDISGPNGVAIPGSSFLYLTGTNSYGGGTSVGTSSIVYTRTSAVQGNWAVASGGTEVVFYQVSPGSTAASFSGGGSVALESSNIQVDLTGASTHTGGVNVRFGSHLGIGHDSALGTGTLTLDQNANTKITAVGGTRTVANALQFSTGDIEFTGANNLSFTHTGAKQLSGNGSLVHNSSGVTTIAGTFLGQNTSNIDVNAGALVLGAAVNNGFRNDGSINVGSGATLQMISNSPVKLGPTSLTGGTLIAANGVAVPTGLALTATGTIQGRVSSEAGSLIEATGILTVGDSASFAGFFSNGELRTQQHSVTLLDKNQAVLGSLTEVGTPSLTGVVTAANGVFVDFGRAITGYGTVAGINTLAKASIINGDAAGSSPSQQLDFTGYVKGVGTFTDVTFSGTFSPGLSPAIVPVNNVSLGNSALLVMEIGGLSPGSMHDQLDIGGVLALNGTLDVDLINGFNPAYGNVFNVFDGTTTGTFNTLSLPALGGGLSWDTSDLYSLGNLTVVPEPTASALALLAAGLLARRRR